MNEFDKWFDSLGEYARDEEGEFYSAMKKAWSAAIESTKEKRYRSTADDIIQGYIDSGVIKNCPRAMRVTEDAQPKTDSKRWSAPDSVEKYKISVSNEINIRGTEAPKTKLQIYSDCFNIDHFESADLLERFGCFADPKLEIIFPDCLLDSESDQLPRQSDCLLNKGNNKSKTDCPYWKQIKD